MAAIDAVTMIDPPPCARIAPAHVAIIPVTPKEDTRAKVMEFVDALATELRADVASFRLDA